MTRKNKVGMSNYCVFCLSKSVVVPDYIICFKGSRNQYVDDALMRLVGKVNLSQ